MSKSPMLPDMLKGSLATVVFSLPIAFLFAVFFRLPIPLMGTIGPFGELTVSEVGVPYTLKAIFIAWLFYGALSGFVILFVLGGLAGLVISRRCAQENSKSNKNKMIIFSSIAISATGILFLSTLDYIIGPW